MNVEGHIIELDPWECIVGGSDKDAKDYTILYKGKEIKNVSGLILIVKEYVEAVGGI